MEPLKDFSTARILVIGDVMLDRYWWGTVNRISPEAPVPIVRLDKSTSAAGGAANVALNISGLGAKPILVGVVGDDPDADVLSANLTNAGVDTAGLIRSTNRPTSVKTRIIAHSQQVVRVDSETSSSLNEDEEDRVWSTASNLLSSVDVVVVSDYAKGLLTTNLLRRIIEAANSSGKKIFVDPKGKDYSKYRGASLITPNRKEAAEACNFEESMPDLVNQSGEKLLSDLSLEMLLVTEGEHGMTVFQRGATPIQIETSAKETYDVTGAGDTVIASLAVASAVGYDFLDAAKIANVAAGIVVEQVGTTAVTFEGLKKALQGPHIDD
jgi:rfaE bifunctional protein kinase chain/domain